jgi:signal transduction histidine kinase
MASAADALQYVNIAAFGLLAFVCLRAWLEQRSPAAFWAFATFGLLAAVAVTGPIVDATGDEQVWVTKIVLALVVFFPYFLYRFAVSFRAVPRAFELAVVAATVSLAVWALILPEVPDEGEPWKAGFAAFVAALLVQWTFLSLFVALRLWRAGTAQPTVVRYRVRLLAAGAVALAVVLVLAAAASDHPSAAFELLSGLLTLMSSLLFFIGFAPPKALRKTWREPEERLLRASVDRLLMAAEPEDVTEIVLPQMANMVGASGVALLDADGRVLGSYGTDPHAPGGKRFEFSQGAVVAWIGPYAPLFAQEEFDLLRSLGGFALLAWQRKSQVAQERRALEEADHLKTNFIALASHELRTPATVIHGLASTLHLRGDRLDSDQIVNLRRTLYEQTDRMRRLVDQLLDLSRLEANGIRIDPQPLAVRERVRELVETLAGENARDVTIAVDASLEALVDQQAFDRIVSNLIVNATRYGAPPIEISAEQRDRHFRLTVADRGHGVPAEFVPQLFDRFTRSGDSRERAEGAGLGLAIAKSYAQAHGGDLLYDDVLPHGARFQLVLPTQTGNG